MNETSCVIRLVDLMGSPEGWGRTQGREVYQRLLGAVEANAGVMVFKVSMKGVRRVDISFASETVVEIARRYRGEKGFCLIDLADGDLIENWEAAATKKEQPVLIWHNGRPRVAGPEPSAGNRDAFRFALERPEVRAAEFAEAGKGIRNRKRQHEVQAIVGTGVSIATRERRGKRRSRISLLSHRLIFFTPVILLQ